MSEVTVQFLKMSFLFYWGFGFLKEIPSQLMKEFVFSWHFWIVTLRVK